MKKKFAIIFIQVCLLMLAFMVLASSARATSQQADNFSSLELASWLVADQAIQASLTQSAQPGQLFHYPISYKQAPVANDRTLKVNYEQPFVNSTDFCFEN